MRLLPLPSNWILFVLTRVVSEEVAVIVSNGTGVSTSRTENGTANVVSSGVDWLPMARMTGASLVGVTVTRKERVVIPPAPSSAVTLRVAAPTAPARSKGIAVSLGSSGGEGGGELTREHEAQGASQCRTVSERGRQDAC